MELALPDAGDRDGTAAVLRGETIASYKIGCVSVAGCQQIGPEHAVFEYPPPFLVSHLPVQLTFPVVSSLVIDDCRFLAPRDRTTDQATQIRQRSCDTRLVLREPQHSR